MLNKQEEQIFIEDLRKSLDKTMNAGIIDNPGRLIVISLVVACLKTAKQKEPSKSINELSKGALFSLYEVAINEYERLLKELIAESNNNSLDYSELLRNLKNGNPK